MFTRWYRTGAIYSVDVGLFQDSNNDGVGDFQGLIARLDYLARLGVTTVWLHPVYKSPRRDGGYDISDYFGVHPPFGEMGDFEVLVHEAGERGIRVMLDLVVNHTSDQHPWFQSARSDPNSPFRDWYVWSQTEPPDRFEGMVFPGVEDEKWTWDEVAHAWYRHRFYRFEPDLNTDNPAVREEIQKIAVFWLGLGVSGFRVDAAPFLIEPKTRRDGGPDFSFLRDLREALSWKRGDSVMLAEANVSDDELREYFGQADGISTRVLMVFAFRGFSRADPSKFVAPLVEDGPFSYKHVNVTDERLAPNSLLTWFERMLHARRECEEIGTGDHEILDVGPDHVLVHRATGRTGSTLFLHNLADRPSRLKLLAEHDPEQAPLNFVADSDYGNDVDLDDVHVAGYGYRWIRLRRTIGG